MDETTASDVRAAMREAAAQYLDTDMSDSGKDEVLYLLAAGFRDLDTGTVLTEDGRRAFTDDLDEDAGRRSCSCGTAWADEPGHDDDEDGSEGPDTGHLTASDIANNEWPFGQQFRAV